MTKITKIASLAAFTLSIATWVGATDLTGETEYAINCASCHGADGKGAGEMAKYLNVAPPDLTTLAADNEGVFPFLKVMHVVDGRTGVRGHGDSMPVWGNAFMSQSDPMPGDFGGLLEVRGRILSLVYFLESIQE